MRAYFVPSSLSFIPEEWRSDGTYSEDNWPGDAVLLSDDDSDRYWRTSPPDGCQLGSENGMPCWLDIKVVTPTFSQALAALNAAYVKDRDELCAAWLRAAVADGVGESSRKEDVEVELAEVDEKHTADVAALKLEYGVA